MPDRSTRFAFFQKNVIAAKAVHAYAGSRPHAGTSSTWRRRAPQANTVGGVLVPPGISGLVLAIQGRASAAANVAYAHSY